MKTIRNSIRSCLLGAVLLAPSAQAQFQWAERVASIANWPQDEPNIGLALDPNGNCYVTGYFDDTNDFGGITLTNQSAGGSDIFVAKYSSSGALQWVQQAGGTTGNLNTGRGIGVDTNGNTYVSGGYGGAAKFGGVTLTSTSGEEFFLAKYNQAGAVQWVQVCTNGSSNVDGLGLTVDGAGNSYALVVVDDLGGAGGTVTFGSTDVVIPANGGTTLTILVKYDNTGAAKWAELFNSSQESYATKVAVDAAGNVYVCGTFKTNLIIGKSNIVASAGSPKDFFIAKFNSSGNLIWVQHPASLGGSTGEGGLVVDSSENVYFSGAFTTNINFGNGIILTNQANAGTQFGDAFLAQYNSAGTAQWARAAGGTNGGLFFDVALDAQTNLYASGFLGYNATVAKYNAAGRLQWTASASGPPASPAASTVMKGAVDATGHCFLVGFYTGTASFDATTLQPQEAWNFFLTKMAPLPFPITTNNGIAGQAGIFTAFSGSNYLVGIQGDGTAHYTNITAQLVSTNGTLTGSRIAIGRTGGIPYVGYGGTNYVLVWSDNKLVAGGGNDQVYGQFVNWTGGLVGRPFTFGPTSEEQDMIGGAGSMLAFDGKNYLAVWDTGAFHNATSGNVHAALFSQAGTLVKPIIDITSDGNENPELTPAVAFGETNYLVVWNDVGEGYINGTFISRDGIAEAPFVISETWTSRYNPLCAAFDGTNFLVVWNVDVGLGYPAPTVWNLYGRLVSPAGMFVGDEVAMISDTNQPMFPSVAFDGANYLLAWNEGVQSTNSQIQFQYFDRAANPVGAEFNLFSAQGTNQPLFGGVLFDGRRFQITGIVGRASGDGPSGINFTKNTATYGTFLAHNINTTLPPRLSAPQITSANTSFSFQLSGPAGGNFVLQVSTNLLNWSSTSTSAIPASGTLTLTNAIVNYDRRFYRVQLQ